MRHVQNPPLPHHPLLLPALRPMSHAVNPISPTPAKVPITIAAISPVDSDLGTGGTGMSVPLNGEGIGLSVSVVPGTDKVDIDIPGPVEVCAGVATGDDAAPNSGDPGVA
ncbi:hypothetical protein TWF281_008025 [Arthrobotrys megalospora]